MGETIDNMKLLRENIEKYKLNHSTFDIKELQEIRDSISLSLFYLSNEYALLKHLVDTNEYFKKRKFAQECESLRVKSDEITGKRFTREQITDKAFLNSTEESEQLINSERDFFEMKLIFDTSNQILNSLSSRINLRKNV